MSVKVIEKGNVKLSYNMLSNVLTIETTKVLNFEEAFFDDEDELVDTLKEIADEFNEEVNEYFDEVKEELEEDY